MERVAELTEKTMVPITLVITIALAAMWISEMHSHVSNMEKLQDEYAQTVKKIDERLSRIEGKMGVNFGSENKVSPGATPLVPSQIRCPLRSSSAPLATIPGV